MPRLFPRPDPDPPVQMTTHIKPITVLLHTYIALARVDMIDFYLLL